MESIQPSTHADWERFAEAVQQDINSLLDELLIEIQLANLRLEQAHKVDPEKARLMAINEVEYFDSNWGYMGDVFLVTGNWWAPRSLSYNSGQFILEHERREACNMVVSNGFIAFPEEDDLNCPPVIGLSFKIASHNLSSHQLQCHIEILAYAKIGEISMQFLRPGGSEAVSGSIDELSLAISTADKVLTSQLNNEKSKFYQASAGTQREFLEKVIKSVSETLPSPTTLERFVFRNISLKHFFIKTNQSVVRVIGSDDQPLIIEHGIIRDFTILDTINNPNNVPYLKPSELYATDIGICALVEPTITNFELPEGEQYIIVPLKGANIGDISIFMETPNFY